MQKEVANWLDKAANRANCKGLRGATSKQCWYAAGLLLQVRGEENMRQAMEAPYGEYLTATACSQLIESLKYAQEVLA